MVVILVCFWWVDWDVTEDSLSVFCELLHNLEEAIMGNVYVETEGV